MKISGGAWKLVLAFFFLVGVWFNFLLSQLCYMYFELACAFGLVVWYGWTYQDRKAEYDETRAKIAQTEEHLRHMQESQARAEKKHTDGEKPKQEKMQREIVEAQPAFDRLAECYKAYDSLPKTLEREDFIDSQGYVNYVKICKNLIDSIDAISLTNGFKELFKSTLVAYNGSHSMYESTVFSQGLISNVDVDYAIKDFFGKIKIDAKRTKDFMDLCYKSTYGFDRLMESIATCQPEADISAPCGEKKYLKKIYLKFQYPEFPRIHRQQKYAISLLLMLRQLAFSRREMKLFS